MSRPSGGHCNHTNKFPTLVTMKPGSLLSTKHQHITDFAARTGPWHVSHLHRNRTSLRWARSGKSFAGVNCSELLLKKFVFISLYHIVMFHGTFSSPFNLASSW